MSCVRCGWCSARHHPHRTHDTRSGSQDHHPPKNSVQKTIRCNSTSSAPDDGRMYPKYFELRIKSSHITGLDRPRGFQEIKVPRFRDNGTGWWWVVSLTYRLPLPPGKCSLYSFLLEAESTPGRSEGFYVNEESTDISWDRTSDLSICGTAP